jgi:hypothetical protein
MTALRLNLRILAPSLLWSGLLGLALCALVLFQHFAHPERWNSLAAGWLFEQMLTPVLAAFLTAGVLDPELKKGAHEILLCRRSPVWKTLASRVFLTVGAALLLGNGVLLALHFGVERVPIGMVALAGVPSALCLAMIALWARVRLGNLFGGHIVALAAWTANLITGELGRAVGISINPLLTVGSYTDYLQASSLGRLESTPYVDWWWVSKLALLVVSGVIFFSITRRVEKLVEGE